MQSCGLECETNVKIRRFTPRASRWLMLASESTWNLRWFHRQGLSHHGNLSFALVTGQRRAMWIREEKVQYLLSCTFGVNMG